MKKHQEKKLGRGLSALLGENKKENSLTFGHNQNAIEKIDLKDIVAGIYQPRRSFSNDELQDLANSIKEQGIIQPIILRKKNNQNGYEIIAGERRFRAAKLAKLKEIPAIVKKLSDQEALELALIENVQRSDLSAVEEAEGYKKLIEEFSYTQDLIAKKVGKSRSHITNLLRILVLPTKVRNMVNEKKISMGHARAIIGSKDPERLIEKMIENSLSVRDVEDMVRSEKNEKVKTSLVSSHHRSKAKISQNNHLHDLEKKLSEITGLETKISYDSKSNSGKILIKFSKIDKLEKLINKLDA